MLPKGTSHEAIADNLVKAKVPGFKRDSLFFRYMVEAGIWSGVDRLMPRDSAQTTSPMQTTDHDVLELRDQQYRDYTTMYRVSVKQRAHIAEEDVPGLQVHGSRNPRYHGAHSAAATRDSIGFFTV